MLHYLQNNPVQLIVVPYRWLHKYVQVIRLMVSKHVACDHIDFV